MCIVVGNDLHNTKSSSGGTRVSDSKIEFKIEYTETVLSGTKRAIAIFVETMEENCRDKFLSSSKRLRMTNWCVISLIYIYMQYEYIHIYMCVCVCMCVCKYAFLCTYFLI